MTIIAVYSQTIYDDAEEQSIVDSFMAEPPTTAEFRVGYPDVAIPYSSPQERERAIEDAKTVIAGQRVKDRLGRNQGYSMAYRIMDLTIVEAL